MTKPLLKANILRQAALAMILIASISYLVYYYFQTGPPAEYASFYKSFPLSGFTMDEQDIKDVLSDNKGSELDKMIVDSAFLRFQMDPGPNGIFDKYMDRLNHGLWMIPESKAWRQIFEETQARWNSHRSEFLASNAKPHKPEVSHDSSGRVVVEFYPPAHTWGIGKSIQVLAEIPKMDIMGEPAKFYWSSGRNEAETKLPGRLATWETSSKKTASGKFAAVLTIDLSSQPYWFSESAKNVTMVIDGQDVANWDVMAVRLN